jgi:hypothetical protein
LNVRLVGDSVTTGFPVPFPVSETACGEPGPLSETLSDAESVTVVLGVNVTLIVQFVPPGKLAPHVFVGLKSPELLPVMVMLVIVSGALPVLLKVTFCGVL